MNVGEWTEEIGLRFVERTVLVDGNAPGGAGAGVVVRKVRILQHRWRRHRVEHRDIAGRSRLYAWDEYEWRDVPLEVETVEPAAAPGPQPGDLDYPDSAPDTEAAK